MTTQETIDYYANLLILQYKGKPRAVATVKAVMNMIVADLLPSQVRDGFSIDTATGAQLAIIGKYAGVSRTGYSLAGDPITLSDVDFRILIRIAVLVNTAQGSLAEIHKILSLYFPGKILVNDYQNMQISYRFDPSVGSSDLAQMFITQGLLPRPMAVSTASLVYSPGLTTFFGMRTYENSNPSANPFNTYQAYNQTWPWLDYFTATIVPTQLSTEDGMDTLVQEDGTSQIYF